MDTASTFLHTPTETPREPTGQRVDRRSPRKSPGKSPRQSPQNRSRSPASECTCGCQNEIESLNIYAESLWVKIWDLRNQRHGLKKEIKTLKEQNEIIKDYLFMEDKENPIV